MIFGNIKNLKEYSFLEEQIKKCFAFAAEYDLSGYEKGKYTMEGNDLFVNVTEYTTAQKEECFWMLDFMPFLILATQSSV